MKAMKTTFTMCHDTTFHVCFSLIYLIKIIKTHSIHFMIVTDKFQRSFRHSQHSEGNITPVEIDLEKQLNDIRIILILLHLRK